MNTVINVAGLTKKFGSFTAVDGVDMSIQSRQVYGFLGPNGSGKTTVIRMMCGLLEPTDGNIEVLGMRVPQQTEQIRRQVGYMTQKFSLYGDLSVIQNMRFMARIMGVYGRKMNLRINELLERFKLDSFRHRMAGSLSGGQKRRLALAAAVIHQPRVLLLDEPTSEVDPNTRREFWDELFLMCEAGTTILVTTHLMDEAERCHHLAIINEGHKVADGTPKALKDEIGARIFIIDGPEITQIKERLKSVDQVIATARVGLSLRVVVKDLPETGNSWMKGILKDFSYELENGNPSIEDVFVAATKPNGNSLG